MSSPRLAVEPTRKIMVAEVVSRILIFIFVALLCFFVAVTGGFAMADIAVDAVEGSSSRSSDLPILLGEQPTEQQLADYKLTCDQKFRSDTECSERPA